MVNPIPLAWLVARFNGCVVPTEDRRQNVFQLDEVQNLSTFCYQMSIAKIVHWRFDVALRLHARFDPDNSQVTVLLNGP